MHFIQLTKFKKDYKDLKTALDRWVSFLNKAYEIDKDKMPKELAEDENIRKAEEKGENNKAFEIAKNMLLDNEDVEKIIRYTKLSIDEVRKLKEVMEL